MGSFFKTFFICLIVTFGFLSYKYFSSESYSNNLAVSKNSPVFGQHKDIEPQNPQPQEPVVAEKPPVKQNEQPKPQEKKYAHTCYFYSVDGTLVPVKRMLSAKPTVESTILLLLKGPTIPETKKGIYSEIPANVDLISAKTTEKGLIVNLSANFGNGGGTQSVENRIKQLAKTIKTYSPNQKIYLYINGKEVEYLGGEGVYIKQPLE